MLKGLIHFNEIIPIITPLEDLGVTRYYIYNYNPTITFKLPRKADAVIPSAR